MMNRKQVVTYLGMLIGTFFTTSSFGFYGCISQKEGVNIACNGECQGATIGDGDDEKTNAP
jgi:hypothetical protein